MQATLQDIAQLVNGQLHGKRDIEITGVATMANAGPKDITLAAGERFLKPLSQSEAAAVVVPQALKPQNIAYVWVDDVHAAFATIASHFRQPREFKGVGISPSALISSSARISSNVDIYPGAVIGDDVEIGSGSIIHTGVCIMAGSKLAENVVIFPNAVLYENTVIGPQVVIHSGAIVGAYGFGYENVDGRNQRSAQLGHVEIEAHVEIGACTTIDRGTYDATVIGEGTKIDNQVMIAHNCRIGRHNLICSQVGIAGSVTTGDYAVFAGQVGIKDHINIGDRARLCAKAGIMNDVPDDAVYLGIPATPYREQRHVMAMFTRLPDMRKQLKQLERTVAELQRQFDASIQKDAA